MARQEALRSAGGSGVRPGSATAGMSGGPGSRGRPAIRRELQLFRRAFVDLFVDRLRNVFEPLAIGRATHHISDLVVDPVERSELLVAGVTQRRLRLPPPPPKRLTAAARRR